MVKNTEDVGARFADEARRIHYGEADARSKGFQTAYYSADIHAGAQHLPPFVAAALAG